LLQNIDRELSREALEELAVSREADVIGQLFDRMRKFARDDVQSQLAMAGMLGAIGDKDGDVYDLAAKLLVADDPATTHLWNWGHEATIMAKVNSARASVDFRELLKSRTPRVKHAVTEALAAMPNRANLDLAFELLADNELAGSAGDAINRMISYLENDERDEQLIAELAEVALPRIKAMLADPATPDAVQERLQRSFGYRFESGRLESGRRQAQQALLSPQRALARQTTWYRYNEFDDHDWLKHNSYTLETLKQLMQEELTGKSPRHLAMAIHRLHEFEPQFAEGILEQALDKRAEYDAGIRFDLLSLALRYGRQEFAEEAIQAAADVLPSGNEEQVRWALVAVRESDNAEALQKYVAYVCRPDRLTSIHGRKWFESQTSQAISGLFQPHPGLYLRCIVDLLEADTLAERHVGVEMLRSLLYWDFGFQPARLQAWRENKLNEIRPLVDEWVGLDQPGLRAAVLRHLGLQLPGDLGPSWLDELIAATADNNAAVAKNALCLIGTILDRSNLEALYAIPADYREQAVREEIGAATTAAAETAWQLAFTLATRCRRAIFSPDGKLLVTDCGGYFQGSRLWDAASGNEIRVFEQSNLQSPFDFSFSPSGRWLVADSDGEIKLWEVQTGKLARRFQGAPGLQFCAGEDLFVTYHPLGLKPAQLWSVEADEALLSLDDERNRVCFACLSADGQRLLAVPHTGTAQLWDVKSRKLLGDFAVQRKANFRYDDNRAAACFAPDGKRFAVVNGRGVEIWSVEPLEKVGDWTPDGIESFNYLAWSKTGERLIVAKPHSPIVLDGDGKWLYGLGELRAPQFSPDGRSMIAGGDQIQILDGDNGKRLATFEPPANSAIYRDDRGALQLSPDGKSLLAVGGAEVRVWKRD
jgi:hypothetical protein